MFKKITFALITCLTFASTSFAAVDLTNFSVDSATPEAMAALILPALGVIWGIRKLIKLANRS